MWKGLEQATTMGVDEYALFCTQQLSSKQPPPYKLKEVDWRTMREKPDTDRIYYMRTKQHSQIAQSMTDAQKAKIKEDMQAALKDLPLLRAIAAQSGYIVPEVADCLRTLRMVRTSNQRLMTWKASGRPMPNGRDEISKVMSQVRREEGEKEWKRLRASANPGNCPVARKVAVLTPQIVCSLTKLPYYNCCGAISRQAAAAKSR